MYNHIIFFNTTNSYYSEVLYDILIHFRLPHHLLISNWFDSLIIPKFLIVLYALYLYRRTKIFPILFCLFIIPLVLSILQLITGNRILAYAMPWRVFMILVPLASTLVLMQIIHKLDSNVRFINSKYCVIVGVIVLGFLVYKGIDISRKSFTNYFNQPESNVVNFIRNNSSENDVYLVNEQFRSFDFENFRLLTGKPLFVDYKLHPYKKDEIVEWYNRIVFSHNFFSKGECGSIKKFATEFKVTHIVQRKTNTFSCPGLTKIYEDKNYILYIIQSV